MNPELSVLVCTWNRAALLRETIEHLARAAPSVPWELVIVDNNSTDATAEVIAAWKERLPIRPIFERRAGIAHARNAALEAARADCMLWLDDDVAVPTNWIDEYQAAFRAWPQTGLFGGPILPRFEVDPPSWLMDIWDKVSIIYGECNYGDEELALESPSRLPYGANFAMRRAAVDGRSFDTQLGRRPHDGGALAEETSFFAQLLTSGVQGRWIPRAAVRHWVPRANLTVDYIRRQYELYGKTCVLRAPPERPHKLIGGVPRWALRKAVEYEVRYRLARFSGEPRRWIEPLMEASAAWGVVKFCARRA